MEIDKWIGSYKVRAFPWIDGKRIYFNVQYYAPGQSIEKPPVWDKTAYVTDNENELLHEREILAHWVDVLKKEVEHGTYQNTGHVLMQSGAGLWSD